MNVEQHRENKQKIREVDRFLGEQYRRDPSAAGISYGEYKKNWQESIKLRQLKTRYSAFEPMPNESVMDFKKRLRTVVILMPTETNEEFNQRVGRAFHK